MNEHNELIALTGVVCMLAGFALLFTPGLLVGGGAVIYLIGRWG